MARRQLTIQGTEKPTIVEIDSAAEAYVEARDERMKLTDAESEAHDALLEVMKKHNIEVYRDMNAIPPLTVTRTPGKEKVKVTRAQEEEGEGSDD
jgi:hypothetical protein